MYLFITTTRGFDTPISTIDKYAIYHIIQQTFLGNAMTWICLNYGVATQQLVRECPLPTPKVGGKHMLLINKKKRPAITKTSKGTANSFANILLQCIYGKIKIFYALSSFRSTPGKLPNLKQVVITHLVKIHKTDPPIVTTITIQLEKVGTYWMLNGHPEATMKRGKISCRLFFATEDGNFHPFNKVHWKRLDEFQKKLQ
jgi:hypothetical protein